MQTVSNAPLVVFRVLFGLLMVLESFGAIATGWVHRTYVEPTLTFPVLTCGWPPPVPGQGMIGWFVVMGCAALGVMLGWRYRLCAWLLSVLWTGAYLMQTTSYNNHYYLAVLVCWAMSCMPAHRRAALDVRRTGLREEACPAWIPRAFRLQLGIVFTYAAIAKLYPGWLGGEYLAVNLGSKGDRWLLGPLLVEPWFQRLIAFAGIGFDALVIPALLWKRTRMVAFCGLVVFNLFNSLVFRIGIFPYMVLALAVFFFEPPTIERIFRWIPGLGRHEVAGEPHATPRLVRAVLVIYFAVQIALPLRHHLYEGDVNWTEEGHRMSWRMMLRTKSGTLRLVARDPNTGKEWAVDQDLWLTEKQKARVAVRPDMLYQFVQHLKADFAEREMPDVELYARVSLVSLNGTARAPLYDSSVDLAQVDWDPFGRDRWVLDRAPLAERARAGLR